MYGLVVSIKGSHLLKALTGKSFLNKSLPLIILMYGPDLDCLVQFGFVQKLVSRLLSDQ